MTKLSSGPVLVSCLFAVGFGVGVGLAWPEQPPASACTVGAGSDDAATLLLARIEAIEAGVSRIEAIHAREVAEWQRQVAARIEATPGAFAYPMVFTFKGQHAL